MKKRNKKKAIILLLLFLAVGMGIGYSILSNQLKIQGTATIATNYSVEIVGIEKWENPITSLTLIPAGEVTLPGEAEEVEEPSYTSTTATFNVKLSRGEEISYKVKVENTGDMDALIDSVTVSQSGSEVIKVDTPVDIEGMTLVPGVGVSYPVKVSFDDTKEIDEEELEATITVTIDTKQSVSAEKKEFTTPRNYITFGDVIKEGSNNTGVKIVYNTFYVGFAGGGPIPLYESIDGSEYELAGDYLSAPINEYYCPERTGTSSEPHTIKLTTDVTEGNEITLVCWY